MKGNKWLRHVSIMFVVLTLVLTGCFPAASNWTRRDMPTDGLERVVTYNLRGPAGTDQEVNRAMLRGLNNNAPTLEQEVIFDRMSGSKTQDVKVTLPDGRVCQALGMVKTQRFAGLTNYMSLESATFSGVDYNGKVVCGAKIRMQFNRNLVQYIDPNKRDWDSIWYYDVPCQKDGNQFNLDLDKATFRALVMSEVWQARIASGPYFFNWGHSVTSLGGPASRLTGGWWTHWDIPATEEDTMGAYQIVNGMVLDLETSPSPWVEFNPAGDYRDAYLIYSAGDADQYFTWNRIFLDRQNEYAVLYRPDRTTPWGFITVRPIYNVEWNDVAQNLAALRGLNPLDPFRGRLDDSGMPKNADDDVIKEFERIGWMNAPNASLEQIQINDESGKTLYAMTIRAFIGANDTLVMFGKAVPPKLAEVNNMTPVAENLPMPVLYDNKGNPLSQDKQPYTTLQWSEWLRESTMWNFLRDNPNAVRADTMIQYRFSDNTKWAPITCTDSKGNSYTCGYTPVEWNLSTSYYIDGGVREPWLTMQFLGEVGVRTLGMSYASGRFEGTGMLFALAQELHREEFFSGYQPESLWRFDARASQLPDTLAEAWTTLHK